MSIQFHIDAMTCGGCARGVTSSIKSIDPDAIVVTDPPNRSVRVESSASEEKLKAALREAGFPVREQ